MNNADRIQKNKLKVIDIYDVMLIRLILLAIFTSGTSLPSMLKFKL